MEKNIKKYIDEFKKEYPNIKNEKDIEKIISLMIKTKPEIKINNDFKNNLKNKLKIKTLEKNNKNKNTLTIINILFGSLGVLSLSIIIGLNYIDIGDIKSDGDKIETMNIRSLGHEQESSKMTTNDMKMNKDSRELPKLENITINYVYNNELNFTFEEKADGFISNNNTNYFEEKTLDLVYNIDNIFKIIELKKEEKHIMYDNDSNNKNIQVNIGNPKIKYTNQYVNDNENYYGVITPSIIFEIEELNTDIYLNKNLIIPLYKNMYNYDDNGNIISIK